MVSKWQGKTKVYISAQLEKLTSINEYFNLSLLDSILIPVEFQRNSSGIPQESTGIHRNSTGMTGFLQDSCRNRWGTVKY